MKLFSKITAVALMMAFAPIQASAFQDDQSQMNATAEQIEQSKLVTGLIAKATESNDAIFYMAAAKLFDGLGPVTILKEEFDESKDGKYTHDDFWSASAAYAKVVEIAGANSELGKQAAALAKSTNKDTGAEGCYGYSHYHFYWHHTNQRGWHKHITAIHHC
jgi:hypothetical protein